VCVDGEGWRGRVGGEAGVRAEFGLDLDLDLQLGWLLRLEGVVLPRRPRRDVTVDDQPPHAAVEPLRAPVLLLQPLPYRLQPRALEHLVPVRVLRRGLW
jgi:hypothetical protein